MSDIVVDSLAVMSDVVVNSSLVIKVPLLSAGEKV